jgi:hypothetical protein
MGKEDRGRKEDLSRLTEEETVGDGGWKYERENKAERYA